jgi:hypothetical protein
LENIPASRERRLNSIVADATWKTKHGRRGFQPTAKFNAPLTRQEELRSDIRFLSALIRRTRVTRVLLTSCTDMKSYLEQE